MDIQEALLKRRTVRLYQQKPVPKEDLEFMVDAARLTSCAANLQRLRFAVVRNMTLVNRILEHTAWAALVKPRRTPVAGKTGPAAFIIVTAPAGAGDIIHADAGAAIQSMQLAAFSRGLGCCWLASVDKTAVADILNLTDDRIVLYALATGYPAESPVEDTPQQNASIAYFLAQDDTLHVPKLPRDDVSAWY